MIESGEYNATLVGVTFGKSKNTGTPCIASEWYIEEEETKRTVYTYLSKKAKKNSFKKLETMGFNGDFDNPEFSIEQTQLLCTISEYEDDSGESQENEKWDFASWGSPGVEDADRKTVKQLNAEWKKSHGSSAPAKKKGKPKSEESAKPPKPKKDKKDEPEPEPEEVPEDENGEEDEDALTPYEQAWDAFIEHKASEKAIEGLENNKRQTALMEWSAILEDAIPDKDEEDFDDEDWEGVRKYCVTPF